MKEFDPGNAEEMKLSMETFITALEASGKLKDKNSLEAGFTVGWQSALACIEAHAEAGRLELIKK
jgi:hypothetical protein